MSDTDKITSANVDEEYTSTVGIFPDNIAIQKGATTHDLTRTKHSGVVSQYKVIICNVCIHC